MTPNEETDLADRTLGAGPSALVMPDAAMGSQWISGRNAAVNLALGAGLMPLTSSELGITAHVAAILGGYRSRRAAQPDSWL